MALLGVGALVLSSCDWPEARYGSEGTGFNPFEATIGTSNVSGLQQRWSEPSVDGSAESAPVVVKGVVYANSAAGRLDAFDELTGTGKWSLSLGSGVPTVPSYVMTPAVDNGMVYDIANDSSLVAINATSGVKLWSASAIVQEPVALVVANGIVYVTDAYGSLWAFDATTGANLWSRGLGSGVGSRIPVVANGLVYVNAVDSAGLSAFNATTGVPLWQTSNYSGSNVGPGGSPAVANGIVYVTSDSKLSAFNATTGALLWSANTGSPCGCFVTNFPAIANGVVYTSADDGTLSAFNAVTGALLWSTASGTVGVSPVVANGVVYVGGDDGGLDAFDANTGTKLWKLPIAGTDDWPVVDDGLVFAGSNDGHVYTYSLPISGAGLTVSPTFVPDYGTLLDGTSSAPTTFTVTNFGSGATTAISDTLTGPDPSQFDITSDTCAGKSLAAQASCTIQGTFAPTRPGVQTATFAISAATGGSASATLSGTGNALTIDPAGWDFGSVPDSMSSSPTTFTVTNHSSITVNPVATLSDSQFTASSDTCSGATLAAGATCTVTVSFTPTDRGSISATLSVNVAQVLTSATLTGTGLPVEIVPATGDYGVVPVGSSSSATFTITIVSSPAQFLLSTSVSGSGFSITSDSCNGQTLVLGQSCTVVVTFAPSVSGPTYNGQLSLSAYFLGSVGQATLVGTGG
jgi:hypothetical protein